MSMAVLPGATWPSPRFRMLNQKYERCITGETLAEILERDWKGHFCVECEISCCRQCLSGGALRASFCTFITSAWPDARRSHIHAALQYIVEKDNPHCMRNDNRNLGDVLGFSR